MKKRIRYQAADGTAIVLEVPWGDGSGRIPPPIISFYVDRQEVQFVYQGDRS